MPNLYPIQMPDGAGGLEPYRYAVRDSIGVEADGDTPQRGFNEALAWLRRVEEAAGAEHTLSGVHDTRKIPRAFIRATWDGSNFAVDSSSYVLGATGAAVATIAVVSTGIIDITLASPMAGTNYGIEDCPISRTPHGLAVPNVVRIQLDSISSTTKFRVRRYEGTEAVTLALATGDLTLVVHGDA